MNNPLKQRLAAGEQLFGCWLSLASPMAAEALAQRYDIVLKASGATTPLESLIGEGGLGQKCAKQ